MAKSRKHSASGQGRQPSWAKTGDDRLLSMRMCDLGVRIEGTAFERRTQQIYDELAQRGIRFRPHFWVSDEWFTPGGVPGVAVPFYLMHPRLVRLERTMMLDAEGSTHDECMRILRHEVGHAIDHAYLLGRRARWRELFGNPARQYPTTYRPRPTSRRYVQHLAWWYAQAHPDEDFAETFAVWLTPRSGWRQRYRGWPALKKLLYVDELMSEIAGQRPKVSSRRRIDSIASNTTTLAVHYRRKQNVYGRTYSDFYDRDLRRLFSDAPEHARKPSAAAFLRIVAPELRSRIAYWTGESQYTLDQLLKELIGRCQELRLRLAGDSEQAKVNLVIVLTMHTMQFLQSAPRRLRL